MRRTQLSRLTTLTLLTAALSACGGGGAPAPGPGPSPDIASIVLTPQSLNLTPGATAPLSATAKTAAGETVPNVTFTWATSNAAVATVAGGVVSAKSLGNAAITASAGGVTSAPAAVNVAQEAPAGGFDLSLSADKLPVTTGTTASLTINVARRTGFTGAVTLTLQGLPAGASAAPVSVPAGQTTATVTVSATAAAPHSLPTTVTLRGESGSVNATKALTVTVRGPAGSVDTSFGAGGALGVDFASKDDYATAMAVQGDGRVILAGHTPGNSGEGQVMALARLTRDGQPDPTFGQGGKALVNFGSGNDQAYAVAVQPDGKIVVAGFATVENNRDFALARLNADGSPDASFGSGGKVTLALGTEEDRAYAVLLQPDGKIVLGGTSHGGTTTGLDFALARFQTNGQVDSSFGAGGKVVTPLIGGGASEVIFALAQQGTAIVAAGGEGDFQVARYTASGDLDATFSGDGKVTGLYRSSTGAVRGVQVMTDGKLLLAGSADNDTAVARLNADGSPDTSFVGGGKTSIKVSAHWDEANGVAVQADGKIVLGGWAHDATTTGNFAAVRLNPAGALDTGFAEGGIRITPQAPSGRNDHARALVLQPDDRVPAVRVLLAGERVPNFSDFAVTRLWD